MLHSDDRQSLQRMLKGEIPADVVKEAELRTQLYHRNGTQGRLGDLECLNIIRFMGLGQADEVRNNPLQTYDFRSIPIGTEIWVKNEEDGYYHKAQYVGDHPGGRIAVRYQGSKDTYGVKPVNCLRHEPPLAMLKQGLHLASETVVVDSPVDIDVEVSKKAKGKKPEPAGV